MSVTPCVMLSRLQPDTGCSAAAAASDGATRVVATASSAARCARVERIIISTLDLCGARSSKAQARRVTCLQGRRLIDAADQPLQPKREPASLLLREKTPQLALTAVRLDREPARMQARGRAAKFNLRPMPREHELNGMPPVPQLDSYVGIRDS